jgi:hypothetical protein
MSCAEKGSGIDAVRWSAKSHIIADVSMEAGLDKQLASTTTFLGVLKQAQKRPGHLAGCSDADSHESADAMQDLRLTEV